MKLHPGWLAAGLILTMSLACRYSTRTNSNFATNTPSANTSSTEASSGAGQFISEIHMAKDDGSGDPEDGATNVFSAEDRTIHCVTQLKEAEAGTHVRFSWWVVESEGANNEKIKDVDYTTKARESIVHSHLTLPRDWPAGKYKVDVYVNEALDRTIPFSVQ